MEKSQRLLHFLLYPVVFSGRIHRRIIPSTRTASRTRLHHSFPFHTGSSVWIFFFGQFSIQRLHRIHSPERQPSSSRKTPVGQFLSHILHPLRQCSRFRDKFVQGSTGSSANTAPMGHRNWQKKRSFQAIPRIIRIRRITPTV